MKLREWLDHGEAQLAVGPHSDRARRDAEMLLLHHIGKNKAWLMAHGDDEFGGCASIGYAALLERRRKGEPVQYIAGECEFYGLPFHVTRDVLIPRPETEHVVEKVLELTRGLERPRIVDVGTGTGAIAIALAHKLPAAQITAIDLSSAALAVARENARRNGVHDRIRFVQGDLFSPVAGEQFEVAASNPPYVPETDRALLAVEVGDYEPALALFAGADGLDIYRRLIPAAQSVLVPGGYLALEMGFGQAGEVGKLLTAAGFVQIELTPDLQGIPRVISARRP